jgi:hypothetical protein
MEYLYYASLFSLIGIKSSRFGLSFEYSRTAQLERLPLRLLIGALAMMALWLLGKAVERSGQHRYYQANTLKSRTVLSTLFLGFLVIDDPRVLLTLSHYRAAINAMYAAVQSYNIDN